MKSAPLLRGVLAALLLAVGSGLSIGGGLLAQHGGSLYYLVSGFATLAAGVLLWRRSPLALWLYIGVVCGTLLWAISETGLEFWLLLPRLGLPLALLLLLLLESALCHSSEGKLAFRSGLAASLAVVMLLGLSLMEDESHTYAGSRPPAGATAGVPDSNLSDGSEWRHYGGKISGTRYIPTDQINVENVDQLEIAWTYRTGDLPENYPESSNAYSFQATPLKVDDSLYFCSPHNIVISLDPETGRERWRYDPEIDAGGVYMLACRGVSYHESDTGEGKCPRRLLVATLDARLIALDADTGQLCTDFGGDGEISLLDGLGEVKPGYYLVSSPPAIVGDAAIVGGFVLDNMAVDEPPGLVRAYSVQSGRQIWAWDSGRPQDAGRWQPGEAYTGVLGFFRPKTTLIAAGPASRGFPAGITLANRLISLNMAHHLL